MPTTKVKVLKTPLRWAVNNGWKSPVWKVDGTGDHCRYNVQRHLLGVKQAGLKIATTAAATVGETLQLWNHSVGKSPEMLIIPLYERAIKAEPTKSLTAPRLLFSARQESGAGTNGGSQRDERYKVNAATRDYRGNMFLIEQSYPWCRRHWMQSAVKTVSLQHQLFLMLHTRCQHVLPDILQIQIQMRCCFPLHPLLFIPSTQPDKNRKPMVRIFMIGRGCVLCNARWKEYRMEVLHNRRGWTVSIEQIVAEHPSNQR